MRVPYGEGVASHTGPESCGGGREAVAEALTGVRAGRVLSLENVIVRSADAVASCGRQQRTRRPREAHPHSAWSKTPCMHASTSLGRRSLPREGIPFRDGSREIPWPVRTVVRARAVKCERGTTAMNGRGKSDKPVVPKKPANASASEHSGPSSTMSYWEFHELVQRVKGRGLAKENGEDDSVVEDTLLPSHRRANGALTNRGYPVQRETVGCASEDVTDVQASTV